MLIRYVNMGQLVVQYAGCVVLLVLAGSVVVHAIIEAFHSTEPFAVRAIVTVNNLLFVIIILEVLRTVLDLGHGDFRLQPFIVIGIISSTREILAVSARMSLAEPAGAALRDSVLVLGMHAAVVLALSLALVLVRRFAGLRERSG